MKKQEGESSALPQHGYHDDSPPQLYRDEASGRDDRWEQSHDEEGPVLFEFIVVLKGDPHGIQRFPDSFADYVYLHIGWEKFVRYHRLEDGFVLLFSYFGDRDMSVKVFDETRCRRNYHGDNAEEDDD
ncbi:hypothetical protein QYE76_011664 [Lolium multiflorum]|uniref:TF-B3 domain-containing protein n=1 Tax=Lolium multiflorum TaxID=4521 RepID=A0AAD8X5I4_LOLMU|nr:hypothetical protein QYE76_011664 [Lolium multiflorum]